MRFISLPIMLFIFFSSNIFCDELKAKDHAVIKQYEVLKQQAETGSADDKYALYDYGAVVGKCCLYLMSEAN